MLRRLPTAIVPLVVALMGSYPGPANAQSGISQTAPWVLTDVNLNTVQVYHVTINAKGSLWDSRAPAFDAAESLTVGPYGLPQKRLGGFFEVCVIECLEFGAAVDYGLTMSGALDMQARATAGSVNLSYPMRVIIEYPYWRNLNGGDKITIRTSYTPDRGVWMTSSDARFFAALRARADFFAGIKAQAKAFSIAYPPGGFPGAIDVHRNDTVFDTDRIFQGPDWTPFPPLGPVTGSARLPNLGTNGQLGREEDPKVLSSSRTDAFLKAGVNFTNLVSQGGLGIKLSDKQTFGPFGVEYHVLELAPSLAASAEQQLKFTPRPQITFIVENQGTRATFKRYAGETLELTMPLDGSAFEITPSIDPTPHSFRNDTVVFASAEAVVDPLRLIAGVQPQEFAGITINFPRFNFNPFGGPFHAPLSPRLNLVSFSREFALSDLNAPVVPGTKVVLSPDNSTPRLVSVCTTLDELNRLGEECLKLLRVRSSKRIMYLLADGGYRADTLLLVNDQLMERSAFSSKDGVINEDVCPGETLRRGQACFVLPGALQAQPGTLRVRLQNPAITVPKPEHFSNTIDIHVVPEALRDDQFGFTSIDQLPGVGTPDDFCQDCEPPWVPGPGVAGLGVMRIIVQTRELESRDVPVQFIAPGSTLAWDDVPLQTIVEPETTMHLDGSTPVYSTTYSVTGFIPAGYQTGGEHKLSLFFAGINSPESALDSVTVPNPIPTLESLLTNAGGPTDPAGLRLLLNGTRFTPQSTVEWDGAPRTAVFISPAMLLVTLPPSHLAVGNHAVRVLDPTPGGGASNPLGYVVPNPGSPQVEVSASLTRDHLGALTAVITFQNTGTGALRGLVIQSIKLHVGKGGHARQLIGSMRLPKTPVVRFGVQRRVAFSDWNKPPAR